jgi:hypothetical protein
MGISSRMLLSPLIFLLWDRTRGRSQGGKLKYKAEDYNMVGGERHMCNLELERQK